MALEQFRLIKKKANKSGPKKLTNTEKFINAIDDQIKIAGGKKVKRGRGNLKSWIVDGSVYEKSGGPKAIIAVVNGKPLLGKSGYKVKSANGVAELRELKKAIQGGAMKTNVNKLYAKAKAPAKAKAKAKAPKT